MTARSSSRRSGSAHAAIALCALLLPASLLAQNAPTLAGAAAGTAPAAARQYGAPLALGNGMVRSYVLYAADDATKPVEVGVALSADVLEGLPGGMEPTMLHVQMPPNAPAPYRFVMVDWNPGGHEPPGVYDTPHFDFHFYLTPEQDVMAIAPSDSAFATKANRVLTGDAVPPHYAVPLPPGATAADMAVPGMGVHWIDMRSPELQGMLGNHAAHKGFTKTFIYGSWDGRLTFLEPMITRAHLLTQPDEVIEIPRPAKYPEPGWYPGAYRIRYDAEAKEYHIALVNFTKHD